MKKKRMKKDTENLDEVDFRITFMRAIFSVKPEMKSYEVFKEKKLTEDESMAFICGYISGMFKETKITLKRNVDG